MGFTRAELESYRGRGIPDLMPEHPRLVFVGINPGLWTAATGVPFAHPGNRFYPGCRASTVPARGSHPTTDACSSTPASASRTS